MSKWLIVTLFLCTGLAGACGGGSGSGVASSKAVVSLEDDEITSLCEYALDVIGAPRVIQCGEGLLVAVGKTLSECVADIQEGQTEAPNCTATVGNTESCLEAIADVSDEDWCSDELVFPSVCLPLAACGDVI